ncbi:hypothetical protein FOA52_007005 [Chlamydomonas sp. UWO 241]|nr:hypothetical protein FOA52_007005 [Chlamydomonas sp. UWO 241]
MHPWQLLRTHFHKKERQAKEVAARLAPIHCPLSSTCGCVVRGTARLARHVAARHADVLHKIAAAVVSVAPSHELSDQERHVQSVAVGVAAAAAAASGGAAAGGRAAAAAPAAGVEPPLLLLRCPCCLVDAEVSQLGLSGIERGYARDGAADGPRPGSRVVVATRAEMVLHVASAHEDMLLALASYVDGLGRGHEGSDCPLATGGRHPNHVSLASAATAEHTHCYQPIYKGGTEYSRVPTWEGTDASTSSSAWLDGGARGSCPGVGHFVYFSMDELMAHACGVHVDHMMKVLKAGVVVTASAGMGRGHRCPLSDATTGCADVVFNDDTALLLHLMRGHGAELARVAQRAQGAAGGASTVRFQAHATSQPAPALAPAPTTANGPAEGKGAGVGSGVTGGAVAASGAALQPAAGGVQAPSATPLAAGVPAGAAAAPAAAAAAAGASHPAAAAAAAVPTAASIAAAMVSGLSVAMATPPAPAASAAGASHPAATAAAPTAASVAAAMVSGLSAAMATPPAVAVTGVN